MILILDNFDSFTYNLVDYLQQLACEVNVVRNNISPASIDWSEITGLVLSPGPESPEKANFLMDYLKLCPKQTPILGICLGHQAINLHFGGSIKKSVIPMHGKTSIIKQLKEDLIFEGIENNFEAVRYHSLVVDRLAPNLTAIAESEDGYNMILKHNSLAIYGIQYHPESILTQFGLKILENWLKIAVFSDRKL